MWDRIDGMVPLELVVESSIVEQLIVIEVVRVVGSVAVYRRIVGRF